MIDKQKAKNCWEYWKCSEEQKKRCPAYQTDSGQDCWNVASSFCIGKIEKKIKFCWECPWFKRLNPDFEKDEKKK